MTIDNEEKRDAEGKRHFRIHCEPAQIGVIGSPLGGRGGLAKPQRPPMEPRTVVELTGPDGQKHKVMPISSTEVVQAMQPNAPMPVFEKMRLLATALIAEQKSAALASMPRPGAAAEIEKLRSKVHDLENRPRWRLWFVTLDNLGSDVIEAKTRGEALELWRATDPEAFANEEPMITEVKAGDVNDLLALAEERAEKLGRLERSLGAEKFAALSAPPEVTPA